MIIKYQCPSYFNNVDIGIINIYLLMFGFDFGGFGMGGGQDDFEDGTNNTI